MAEAKKTQAPAEGEAAPKPKKKLLLFIIIGVLVLVLGGGGAAFLLMKKKANADEEADADDEPPAHSAKAKKKKSKDEHAAAPIFTKLDPFVVKLQSEGQEAYVQAVPELRISDAPLAEQVKQFMPEIRHKLLLILAAKKASDLSTPEGMQLLANQIRVSINGTLSGQHASTDSDKQDHAPEDAPVQAVFFSSLIVQ